MYYTLKNLGKSKSLVSLSTYQSARMAEGEAGKNYYFVLTKIMGKNKFFSDLSVAERVTGKHTWIIYFKNCNKTKKNSDTENPNRNQYLGLRENVYMTRKNFGAKLCFWIVLLFLWMVIEFNLALKSFLASVFSIVTCLNYFTMINRNSNIYRGFGAYQFRIFNQFLRNSLLLQENNVPYKFWKCIFICIGFTFIGFKNRKKCKNSFSPPMFNLKCNLK